MIHTPAMEKIRVRRVRRPKDCERIRKALRADGYDVTLAEAEMLWARYSSVHLQSWLSLSESQAGYDTFPRHIVEALEQFIEVIE